MSTDLLWGTFTPQHFMTIAFVPVFCAILYVICRRMTQSGGTRLLLMLSLWGYAAIIYNLCMWGEPLLYLPLHMCSINALLLPVALLSKSQLLRNILPLFSLGAFSAVILNHGMTDARINSWVFIMYYVPHMLEFCIPIVMLLTRRIVMLPRLILPVTLCVFGLFTGVHAVNEYLNAYFLEIAPEDPAMVNYMYTQGPDGIPILTQLWQANPRRYFYLLPLLPVIMLLQFLFNLPQILRGKKGGNVTFF